METEDPSLVSHTMSFEELCRAHLAVARQIEELTEKKEELKRLLLAAMPTKIATTPHYRVTKMQLVTVKTSLENAKRLGYTIMTEQVDKKTIREHYNNGISIPDVHVTEYVKISEIQ